MNDNVATGEKSTHKKGSLISPLQKQYYERDGFLVIKNFLPKEVCNLLIQRARQLIDAFDPGEVITTFSSVTHQHAQHLYFLESGDKIRFFFEEGAISEEGQLKADKSYCINKIGHALHDLDPTFYCASRLHKIAVLLKELGVDQPLLLQSMYICKQPHFGGEVTCHQDSTYLITEKEPVIGLWFALEDATLENGCLWAIPGGHQQPLKSRFIRGANNHIHTEVYDDKPWELSKMIPLEVPKGSVIVLNGLLPHMSKKNTSEKSRHAYTLHFMSSDNVFAKDNWLALAPDATFKGML